MAKNKMTEIVGKIVELLTPLSSDDRQRVVHASLTLVGEVAITTPKAGLNEDPDAEVRDLPAKAKAWVKQNGLSQDELQQAFHISNGTADVIAPEMPGKNKKEKTLNAYVFTGLAKLLTSGDTKFGDKSARVLCESSGCYDNANHSATLKDRGNLFTGSKAKDWMLTAPGLKHGATIVKDLTKQK